MLVGTIGTYIKFLVCLHFLECNYLEPYIYFGIISDIFTFLAAASVVLQSTLYLTVTGKSIYYFKMVESRVHNINQLLVQLQ